MARQFDRSGHYVAIRFRNPTKARGHDRQSLDS
jgi:hypothetical protein